jgi:Saposin-like type B, region 2
MIAMKNMSVKNNFAFLESLVNENLNPEEVCTGLGLCP